MWNKYNFDQEAMAKAGRAHAAIELDRLRADWATAFQRWALSHGAEREMNDLRAELRLRNIAPPFDQVREELVEELRTLGSDNPGVAQAVADFLTELEGPKKRWFRPAVV
jgi:hypothetical protein